MNKYILVGVSFIAVGAFLFFFYSIRSQNASDKRILPIPSIKTQQHSQSLIISFTRNAQDELTLIHLQASYDKPQLYNFNYSSYYYQWEMYDKGGKLIQKGQFSNASLVHIDTLPGYKPIQPQIQKKNNFTNRLPYVPHASQILIKDENNNLKLTIPVASIKELE